MRGGTMKTMLLLTFLVVPLLLTSCAPAAAPAPTPDTALIQTSAANTVIANFTLTASVSTNTPLAALTEAPTSGPLESATAAPTASTAVALSPTLLPGGVTATPGLCDHYTWGTDLDVTIPDGTQMTPGQQFVKTWKIKNDGICTWGAGYK